MGVAYGWQAEAAINPSRFVIAGSARGLLAQAANGTTLLFGISQEWSNYPPIPGALTVAADATGNCSPQLKVYGEDEICLLEAGAAIASVGTPLQSDGSGRGITAVSTGYVGAINLQTASGAGVFILVRVKIMALPKA